MNIIDLDFETYYASDYSLSKMQTDAYILDPRFEIITVCVIDKGVARMHAIDIHDVASVGAFHVAYDWANSAVRCHHAQFDGFILTQVLGIKPKLWMDTLALSRMHFPWLKSHSLASVAKHMGLGVKGTEVVKALGKRRADFNPAELAAYERYCENDTWLAKAIGDALTPRTPTLELKLIDGTVRMFTEPVLVGDQQKMHNLHVDEIARKAQLLHAASVDRSIIMSGEKFATALRGLGISPPMKISPTTKKLTYAFAKSDKAFTDLLEHDDETVQALVAARLGVKTTVAETRALTFLNTAKRGPMPVYLGFWAAKTTGRYAGGNRCNWQNIPARGPSAGLREAICAPEGHVIMAGDSSNIELRMVMACAGQFDVLDKLRKGIDLYCDFASDLFGRVITKADTWERFLGKTACIAEGQMVLTDKGMVPIEEITVAHKVWDGVEFVSHDGVVYKGVKDVIEYAGLTATPDHLVCLEDGSWSQFGHAADQEAHIATTERSGQAVRFLGGSEQENSWKQAHADSVPMPMRGLALGQRRQSLGREVTQLQVLRGKAASWARRPSGVAISTGRGAAASGAIHAGSLYEPGQPELGEVRGARCGISLRFGARVRGALEDLAGLLRGVGGGPREQRRALRSGEFAVCHEGAAGGQSAQHCVGANRGGPGVVGSLAEPVQHRNYIQVRSDSGHELDSDRVDGAGSCSGQEKELAGNRRPAGCARVYDIVNAGPRHRFTVSGKLVHNCLGLQYGAGAERFMEMVRQAARASGIGKPITLDEAQRIVTLYRAKHYKVVQLWKYCNDTVLPDIANGCNLVAVDVHGWCITHSDGFGRPGQPGVVYKNLHRDPATNDWVYEMAGKPVKIFGAKVVENLSQHLARHVVMWQTARIDSRIPVKLSVHDEAVTVPRIEDIATAKAWMTDCLSLAPPWCRDVLPVACEVHHGATYSDCK